LKKLGQLMRQSGGGEPPEEVDDEVYEQRLMEDTNEILELALQKCDGQLFDAQVLIESAAEALRSEIRELVEGPEDGN